MKIVKIILKIIFVLITICIAITIAIVNWDKIVFLYEKMFWEPDSEMNGSETNERSYWTYYYKVIQ